MGAYHQVSLIHVGSRENWAALRFVNYETRVGVVDISQSEVPNLSDNPICDTMPNGESCRANLYAFNCGTESLYGRYITINMIAMNLRNDGTWALSFIRAYSRTLAAAPNTCDSGMLNSWTTLTSNFFIGS